MSLSACSASQADIVPACKKFISDNFRASAAEKTCTCVSDEIGNVIDKKFNKMTLTWKHQGIPLGRHKRAIKFCFRMALSR